MLKDRTVASSSGLRDWRIYSRELLPSNLKLFDLSAIADPYRRGEAASDNERNFIGWGANMSLPMTRVNAKKLAQCLELCQGTDEDSRFYNALVVRCLSINNSYWVKFENEDFAWKDINLYSNSIEKSISLLAVLGQSVTLQAKFGLSTPEINLNGVYAKGCFRDAQSGALYIYKAALDENEVERELSASKALECIDGLNLTHYEKAVLAYIDTDVCVEKVTVLSEEVYGRIYKAGDAGTILSRCKLFTTEDIGFIPAHDIDNGEYSEGLCNSLALALNGYKDQFYQMVIADYLVANSDRHYNNWGFLQNQNTGDIIGLQPIFDLNNAFAASIIANPDTNYAALATAEPYQLDIPKKMSLLANLAVKESGLRLNRLPRREDFSTDSWFDWFNSRCLELFEDDYKNLQISERQII
jgi:hypothetical protein